MLYEVITRAASGPAAETEAGVGDAGDGDGAPGVVPAGGRVDRAPGVGGHP